VKAVVKATFPSFGGAVTTTHTALNYLTAAATADVSGNVGIGASPITTLTAIANGTCQAVVNITDAGSRLGLLHIASNDNQQYGGGGGIVFGAGVKSFAAIKGFTNSGGTNTIGDLIFTTRRLITDDFLTEAVRIYTNGDTLFSGNVGIGTSTVSSRLVVKDSVAKTSASANVAYFGTATADATDFQLRIERSAAGAGGYYSIQAVEQSIGNRDLKLQSTGGSVIFGAPSAIPTLTVNNEAVMSLTSNTNLRISVRGTDGTTRVANITLA
jgi:hypothetical protein